MDNEWKKIDTNTGEKCPLCKNGRIALAQILTNYATLDQEPYTNGVIEGDSDDIQLNESVNLSLHICDNCKEIFSISVENDLRKKISHLRARK